MLDSKLLCLNVLMLAYFVFWFPQTLDNPTTYILMLNGHVFRWKREDRRRQACPSYSGNVRTFVPLLLMCPATVSPLALGLVAWLALANKRASCVWPALWHLCITKRTPLFLTLGVKSLRNVGRGVVEMTQLVECLLHSLEDPSSGPKNPHKS